MIFDIVIPLGPKEINNINTQISYIKQNVTGYNKIYIISYDSTIKIDDCIIVDENLFFIFKEFISNYFKQYNGKNNRNGWYLQQLLKLYAGLYIPDILDNYLVIDADVFFLRKTSFFHNDKPLYSFGDEHHIPYFEHMKRLDDCFDKYESRSGICHHMMYNKNYINEIFSIVESKHNKPFWQSFIECVEEHKKHHILFYESGASEYELYFNYITKHHKEDIIIRELKWCNVSKNSLADTYINSEYDYISICHWLN